MSKCVVNINITYFDISMEMFDTVIVYKKMAKKLKKALENNPDKKFKWNEHGDEFAVKYSEVEMTLIDNEDDIETIRKTKRFIKSLSSMELFKMLWIQEFDNNYDTPDFEIYEAVDKLKINSDDEE